MIMIDETQQSITIDDDSQETDEMQRESQQYDSQSTPWNGNNSQAIDETQCESQQYDSQCSTRTVRDEEETCDLLLTYSQPTQIMHFFDAK
jgi:hypothetical protein